MQEMSKNHIQYPFATFYDHLHRAGGGATSASLPATFSQSSKLPIIPSATLPDNKFSSKDTMGGLRPNSDLYDAGDKLKLLDNKVNLDKSNRALLEEVVRLHGELRAMIRKNQEDIHDERLSRQQIESSLEMVNTLISKLSTRIKMAEDKILEEKSALSSLVTHTKGVEQAVVASQQNLSARKDLQAVKIQEVSLQLNEIQRNRDHVDKLIYNLSEELRTLRSKVDSQTLELTSTVNDLRLRARRIEEESKLQVETLRKQGDLHSSVEISASYLKGQMETRITELRDIIAELRSKQELEANERRALEQQLQIKFNGLQQSLTEQTRKREEALQALDTAHRQKEQSLEGDKLRVQAKLMETVEEMNSRLLNKEIKLREEIQDKFSQLEKMLHSEELIRQRYESAFREENEKRWQSQKKLNTDELHMLKESVQSERQKHKEAVQKLDESVSLIEKQLAEQKRQTDKVVAAEIKSRKYHERSTDEKLDRLNEKLTIVTGSLQTAIGGVTGNFEAHTEKLRAELRTMLMSSEEASARNVADVEVKVQSLKQKVNGLEHHLDGRISEATAILAQNLREKIESISLWQDVTSQTIRELNQSIQDLPAEIFALEDKQKLLKADVDSRLTTETDARIRDIESLKHEVSLLRNRRQPQAASVEDLQELQASVRKLAETVQTVKTVMGMKLQSEQKVREDDVKELQEEVDRLRRKLDPNAANKNYPRNYNNRNNNLDEEVDEDAENNTNNGRGGPGNTRNGQRDDRGDPGHLDDRSNQDRSHRDQYDSNS